MKVCKRSDGWGCTCRKISFETCLKINTTQMNSIPTTDRNPFSASIPRTFKICGEKCWHKLTSLRETKQQVHSPLILWGWDTTAASATLGCSTRADSISAVLNRCPETLTMSSIRPVTQMQPSLSFLPPENHKMCYYSNEHILTDSVCSI